ncbi:uncharacterized protein [Cicer arietinum]|uniref:Uncharacterized protein LOC101489931 isoform X2 n=1 Tax=Cicer arietinum TaxID=3827 RepID=A0A1S3EID4_CICAR|nr:uncharacterized protein LOC101489931 isoform X2 [Cicer arietinum]
MQLARKWPALLELVPPFSMHWLRFYLSRTTIAMGIIGPGLIGSTVLDQLRDQAKLQCTLKNVPPTTSPLQLNWLHQLLVLLVLVGPRKQRTTSPTDRIIMVSGAINEILRAVELILSKLLTELHSEDDNDVEPKTKVRLIVPNGSCGGIIGKGGATIRSIASGLMEEHLCINYQGYDKL